MEISALNTYRYSGRVFTIEQIDWIRQYIAANPQLCRTALSRIVCQEFHWLSRNGRLKEMSCRVAMLRMHRDNLICLPPPQTKTRSSQRRPELSDLSDPRQAIDTPAGRLGALKFTMVVNPKDSRLWNELIERYHYLGHKPLPGAQIRYLIYSTVSGDLLAAMGFGASAWKVKDRDMFIGWSTQQRISNLHLIVNNARFLILPWVTSKNLASRILSLVARQLPDDWQARYNYKPVLLETFVQKDKFKGTCYRAANWILLGQTKGRGKCDIHNQCLLPIKDILVYPLHKDFRNILCSR